MYTTAVCPYCVRAERLLESKGVTTLEKIRVDLDPEQRMAMMEKTGRRTVPQIYIGDTHVGGFDDLYALDQAGGLTPFIEVALDVGASPLAEGIFESTVTITVTAKVKDKVAFLVEGKQAGIFEARNIPAEQLDPLLGIGCPNIVYPYLRANIADVITRAGFPPVHLAEINFEVFYQQRLQAMAEAAAAAPAAAADGATTH
eukprot:gene5596-5475_t